MTGPARAPMVVVALVGFGALALLALVRDRADAPDRPSPPPSARSEQRPPRALVLLVPRGERPTSSRALRNFAPVVAGLARDGFDAAAVRLPRGNPSQAAAPVVRAARRAGRLRVCLVGVEECADVALAAARDAPRGMIDALVLQGGADEEQPAPPGVATLRVGTQSAPDQRDRSLRTCAGR